MEILGHTKALFRVARLHFGAHAVPRLVLDPIFWRADQHRLCSALRYPVALFGLTWGEPRHRRLNFQLRHLQRRRADFQAGSSPT